MDKEKIELHNYFYKPITIIKCVPYQEKKNKEIEINIFSYYVYVSDTSLQIKNILKNIENTINLHYGKNNLEDYLCLTKEDITKLNDKFGNNWFNLLKINEFIEYKNLKNITKKNVLKQNI